MWQGIKQGFVVVGRNIPVGIGVGIGAAIGGAVLTSVGNVLTKGGEQVKRKLDKKVDKVVAEHQPATIS